MIIEEEKVIEKFNSVIPILIIISHFINILKEYFIFDFLIKRVILFFKYLITVFISNLLLSKY